MDGVEASFTFVNSSRVEFATAPASGSEIRIYRETPIATPAVDFSDGAILRADDLDAALTQTRHRAEELGDQLQDASTRSLKVPPGETAPTLPSSVSRANRYPVFDADGNIKLSEGTGSDPALRQDLAGNAGGALVTVDPGIPNGRARTLQDRSKDVILLTDVLVPGEGQDNSAAFADFAEYLASLATPPRVFVPAGRYQYATSPNLAIDGLVLDCAPGVIFEHTGAGVALNLDGGATGGGKYRGRITGRPLIIGNENTTYGIYARAIHHWLIEVDVRDVSLAALRTEWAVADEFRIRVSPLQVGEFSVQPVNGIIMDSRNSGEQTSACRFLNPIIEGVSGDGLVLTSAINNTIIGGTSEANGGGVSISAASTQNTFTALDMEQNANYDVSCAGSRNVFLSLLSDSLTIVEGDSNTFIGGIFNALTVEADADGNQFDGVGYASAAGLFTDNGTRTGKRKVRNQTTLSFDNDQFSLPNDTWLRDLAGNQRLYFATSNTNYYKAPLNHLFRDATDATLATIQSTGIDLPAGKAISINGQQVLGARRTGWTAPTGTAARTGFDTSTATLAQVAQALKALIDDLFAQGEIGA